MRKRLHFWQTRLYAGLPILVGLNREMSFWPDCFEKLRQLRSVATLQFWQPIA
ncbi:MAG TPA: hypothetical protein V6C84_09550 [Coleofasciculaceae cyanobacterium]